MSKNKLIASLLLALSVGFAQADPYQFNFGPTAVRGNIGDTPLAQFSFTVTATAAYSGLLTTRSASLADDEFSQLSLVFTSQAGSFTVPTSLLDLTSSGTELATGIFGNTYTAQVDIYSFAPYVLDAGDWTVALWGRNVDGAKSGDTVSLTLEDPPAEVPEPQSLALAAVALAALGVASRRRNLR